MLGFDLEIPDSYWVFIRMKILFERCIEFVRSIFMILVFPPRVQAWIKALHTVVLDGATVLVSVIQVNHFLPYDYVICYRVRTDMVFAAHSMK